MLLAAIIFASRGPYGRCLTVVENPLALAPRVVRPSASSLIAPENAALSAHTRYSKRPSAGFIDHAIITHTNHATPRLRWPLYQCPRPGTTLRINASEGRHVMSWLNHTVPASGAPHSLQKFASATTTGFPHCEQKRGRSILSSGMEGKGSVAELYCVTIAERCFSDALTAKPTPVLTPQVA